MPSRDAARVRAARLPLFDVRGTGDLSDDVIGCLTCHFAHASPEENLLRWSRGESREACGACHPEIYDPGLLPGTTVAGLR